MKLLMILLLGTLANGLIQSQREPPLLIDSSQSASGPSTSAAN